MSARVDASLLSLEEHPRSLPQASEVFQHGPAGEAPARSLPAGRLAAKEAPGQASSLPTRRVSVAWQPVDFTLALCALAALALGGFSLHRQNAVPALPVPGPVETPVAPVLPWPAPAAPPATAPPPLVDTPTASRPAAPTPGLASAEAAQQAFDAPGQFRITRTAPRSEASLLAANAALGRGALREAARRYSALRLARPLDPAPSLGLGAVALREGRAPDAARHYREALALEPPPAPAFDRGFLPSAAGAVLNHAALQYANGIALAQAGQWAPAHRAFAVAASLAPRCPDYALAVAVALDHLGLHAAAVTAYRRTCAPGGGGPCLLAPSVTQRLASLEAQP